MGRWRRLPGVLAFADGAVSFEGVFGDLVVIPTERIQKIVTGRKLSSERILFRLEALRITRTGGEGDRSSCCRPNPRPAWRSHLGLWAMNERVADAEAVSPGGRAPRSVALCGDPRGMHFDRARPGALLVILPALIFAASALSGR